MTRQPFKVAPGLGLGGTIILTGGFVSALSGSSAICASLRDATRTQQRFAIAQITPDGTLGTDSTGNSVSSVVTPNVTINGGLADRIDGGVTRDTNLFHSFTQFNVGEGQRVYFANPVGIENILTRVTGTNISNIQGTLGVTGGNANLFLINPNGIIFGENAKLDVGGSFVATTANAIGFGNQGFFSATEPEAPALLSVQPSAFFFNQINSGRIENRSIAAAGVDLLGNPLYGLRVNDDRSLLLVGGDIVIDGGGVNALGGRGDLTIRASEFIEMSDLPKDVFYPTALLSGTEGSGQGGNLTISTPLLRLLGGWIAASTSGTGDSGDVTIDTGVLIVQDGGIIAASSAFGEGDGGKLTITASESVQLIGKSADGQRPSGLFTDTKIRGNAGDITIDTPLLLVQDGAQVSAETSAGAGGSITITANTVELINSGQIRTTTAGGENAGNIMLTAQESLILSGTDSGLLANTTEGSSGNGGSIFIRNPTSILIRDGARVAVDSKGTGVGGNIDIQASSVTLENQARLLAETASNTGGNITLQLQDLLLYTTKLQQNLHLRRYNSGRWGWRQHHYRC